MRRQLGVGIAVAMLAAVALFGLAVAAGAQTQTVFSCSYVVGPTVLPIGGGVVTVTGTAPGSSVVRVFANGRLVGVANSAPVTGAFSLAVTVGGSVEVSVALDDYPNTPCIGVGANEANNSKGGVGAGTGSNLAGTGASHTDRTMRVAVVAVALGLVLVVAARRRSTLNGRS